MLILTRKKNEEIIINNNIKITIIESSNDHVKIGIEAPSDIKIFRKELYAAIEDENKSASANNVSILKEFNLNFDK